MSVTEKKERERGSRFVKGKKEERGRENKLVTEKKGKEEEEKS